MKAWLVNGQPGDAVRADDRGLAYGDGLFETIAFRAGGARFIDRHFARLALGCRRLGLPDPPLQAIADEMRQLAGSAARGTLKVIVTRGPGPRGYRAPDELRPTRLVGFDPEHQGHGAPSRAAARLVSCRTPASSNAALAGLKTLNRLDNVLARAEWGSAEADEGLMWDHAGRVAGGTMSNLFLVRGGRLLTPGLASCGVRGVMRGVVIEAAAALGLPAVECDVARSDLDRADEVFLTNALLGLWPAAVVDGRAVAAGSVTRAVAAELRARGVEEAAA